MTVMNKFMEVADEIRAIMAGRGKSIVDSGFPLVIYWLTNKIISFEAGVFASLLVLVLLFAYRLLNKEQTKYLVLGLISVAISIGLTYFFNLNNAVILPSVIWDGGIVLLLIISIVINRPFVAWTSYISRNWPLEWYWHPNVSPAYRRVSWVWVFAFAIKLIAQLGLFLIPSETIVGVLAFVFGWPYLLLLLIVSYVYGSYLLKKNAGPSVEEFMAEKPEPWVSQLKGF